ncbi:Hypothetical protein CINCED_3A022989 [Cinara cedri]|uniref:Uncharacterized protein n=1 Tax=Cinara cedri TaxID=506608 RepID=A0A5E4M2L8_9HEMI|nr:Hypothetical protein CINCED_3A022989 [Cinara cedri]
MAMIRLSDTRWNCRYPNIESVKNSYKVIIQSLEEEIKNDDRGVNEDAKEKYKSHTKYFDTTATTSAEQIINDTIETIYDYFRKNAFFPVFDAILINLEKRFSTESFQMATAVDQFFQLNFEESLFFVDHYKVK